jgi:hypothetical protein
VHNIKVVDHTKYEGYKDNLKILHIDPDADNVFDALGVSDDRGKELRKVVKKTLIDSNDKVEAAQKIAESCNHLNEFYLCIEIMTKEIEMHSSPMGGLMKAIMGMQGPEGPEGPDFQ